MQTGQSLIWWAGDNTMINKFSSIELLGSDVLLQMFYVEHEAQNSLVSLEGELLSAKYGKEVFNVFKVIKVGNDVKIQIQEGDIVSIPDEMLDPIPDGSRGFTNEGQPKAGYMSLGKILPFVFLEEKLTEPQKTSLLFLLPSSWVKIKYNDVQILTKVEDTAKHNA